MEIFKVLIILFSIFRIYHTKGINCQQKGFMCHDKTRFYQCVQNGTGTFTVEDIPEKCPEGLECDDAMEFECEEPDEIAKLTTEYLIYNLTTTSENPVDPATEVNATTLKPTKPISPNNTTSENLTVTDSSTKEPNAGFGSSLEPKFDETTTEANTPLEKETETTALPLEYSTGPTVLPGELDGTTLESIFSTSTGFPKEITGNEDSSSTATNRDTTTEYIFSNKQPEATVLPSNESTQTPNIGENTNAATTEYMAPSQNNSLDLTESSSKTEQSVTEFGVSSESESSTRHSSSISADYEFSSDPNNLSTTGKPKEKTEIEETNVESETTPLSTLSPSGSSTNANEEGFNSTEGIPTELSSDQSNKPTTSEQVEYETKTQDTNTDLETSPISTEISTRAHEDFRPTETNSDLSPTTQQSITAAGTPEKEANGTNEYVTAITEAKGEAIITDGDFVADATTSKSIETTSSATQQSTTPAKTAEIQATETAVQETELDAETTSQASLRTSTNPSTSVDKNSDTTTADSNTTTHQPAISASVTENVSSVNDIEETSTKLESLPLTAITEVEKEASIIDDDLVADTTTSKSIETTSSATQQSTTLAKTTEIEANETDVSATDLESETSPQASFDISTNPSTTVDENSDGTSADSKTTTHQPAISASVTENISSQKDNEETSSKLESLPPTAITEVEEEAFITGNDIVADTTTSKSIETTSSATQELTTLAKTTEIGANETDVQAIDLESQTSSQASFDITTNPSTTVDENSVATSADSKTTTHQPTISASATENISSDKDIEETSSKLESLPPTAITEDEEEAFITGDDIVADTTTSKSIETTSSATQQSTTLAKTTEIGANETDVQATNLESETSSQAPLDISTNPSTTVDENSDGTSADSKTTTHQPAISAGVTENISSQKDYEETSSKLESLPPTAITEVEEEAFITRDDIVADTTTSKSIETTSSDTEHSTNPVKTAETQEPETHVQETEFDAETTSQASLRTSTNPSTTVDENSDATSADSKTTTHQPTISASVTENVSSDKDIEETSSKLESLPPTAITEVEEEAFITGDDIVADTTTSKSIETTNSATQQSTTLAETTEKGANETDVQATDLESQTSSQASFDITTNPSTTVDESSVATSADSKTTTHQPAISASVTENISSQKDNEETSSKLESLPPTAITDVEEEAFITGDDIVADTTTSKSIETTSSATQQSTTLPKTTEIGANETDVQATDLEPETSSQAPLDISTNPSTTVDENSDGTSADSKITTHQPAISASVTENISSQKDNEETSSKLESLPPTAITDVEEEAFITGDDIVADTTTSKSIETTNSATQQSTSLAKTTEIGANETDVQATDLESQTSSQASFDITTNPSTTVDENSVATSADSKTTTHQPTISASATENISSDKDIEETSSKLESLPPTAITEVEEEAIITGDDIVADTTTSKLIETTSSATQQSTTLAKTTEIGANETDVQATDLESQTSSQASFDITTNPSTTVHESSVATSADSKTTTHQPAISASVTENISSQKDNEETSSKLESLPPTAITDVEEEAFITGDDIVADTTTSKSIETSNSATQQSTTLAKTTEIGANETDVQATDLESQTSSQASFDITTNPSTTVDENSVATSADSKTTTHQPTISASATENISSDKDIEETSSKLESLPPTTITEVEEEAIITGDDIVADTTTSKSIETTSSATQQSTTVAKTTEIGANETDVQATDLESQTSSQASFDITTNPSTTVDENSVATSADSKTTTHQPTISASATENISNDKDIEETSSKLESLPPTAITDVEEEAFITGDDIVADTTTSKSIETTSSATQQSTTLAKTTEIGANETDVQATDLESQTSSQASFDITTNPSTTVDENSVATSADSKTTTYQPAISASVTENISSQKDNEETSSKLESLPPTAITDVEEEALITGDDIVADTTTSKSIETTSSATQQSTTVAKTTEIGANETDVQATDLESQTSSQASFDITTNPSTTVDENSVATSADSKTTTHQPTISASATENISNDKDIEETSSKLELLPPTAITDVEEEAFITGDDIVADTTTSKSIETTSSATQQSTTLAKTTEIGANETDVQATDLESQTSSQASFDITTNPSTTVDENSVATSADSKTTTHQPAISASVTENISSQKDNEETSSKLESLPPTAITDVEEEAFITGDDIVADTTTSKSIETTSSATQELTTLAKTTEIGANETDVQATDIESQTSSQASFDITTNPSTTVDENSVATSADSKTTTHQPAISASVTENISNQKDNEETSSKLESLPPTAITDVEEEAFITGDDIVADTTTSKSIETTSSATQQSTTVAKTTEIGANETDVQATDLESQTSSQASFDISTNPSTTVDENSDATSADSKTTTHEPAILASVTENISSQKDNEETSSKLESLPPTAITEVEEEAFITGDDIVADTTTSISIETTSSATQQSTTVAKTTEREANKTDVQETNLESETSSQASLDMSTNPSTTVDENSDATSADSKTTTHQPAISAGVTENISSQKDYEETSSKLESLPPTAITEVEEEAFITRDDIVADTTTSKSIETTSSDTEHSTNPVKTAETQEPETHVQETEFDAETTSQASLRTSTNPSTTVDENSDATSADSKTTTHQPTISASVTENVSSDKDIEETSSKLESLPPTAITEVGEEAFITGDDIVTDTTTSETIETTSSDTQQPSTPAKNAETEANKTDVEVTDLESQTSSQASLDISTNPSTSIDENSDATSVDSKTTTHQPTISPGITENASSEKNIEETSSKLESLPPAATTVDKDEAFISDEVFVADTTTDKSSDNLSSTIYQATIPDGISEIIADNTTYNESSTDLTTLKSTTISDISEAATVESAKTPPLTDIPLKVDASTESLASQQTTNSISERSTNDDLNVTIPTSSPHIELKNDTVGTNCENETYVCPRAGMIAHATDCNKYHLCIRLYRSIKHILVTCLDGTQFDSRRKCCTSLPVQCPNDPPLKCTQVGISPHPYICSRYMVCSFISHCKELSLKQYRCPMGTSYNYPSRKCVETSQALCVPGSSNIAENRSLFTCSKVGRFAVDENCNDFYECSRDSKGKLSHKLKSCGQGKSFDRVRDKCDRTNRVFCPLDAYDVSSDESYF